MFSFIISFSIMRNLGKIFDSKSSELLSFCLQVLCSKPYILEFQKGRKDKSRSSCGSMEEIGLGLLAGKC